MRESTTALSPPSAFAWADSSAHSRCCRTAGTPTLHRIRSGARCAGRSRWISGARARRSGAAPPTAAPRSRLPRAKIGFCNCTAGMTDDAELDRISDFDLFGGTLYPQAAGSRSRRLDERPQPAVRDPRRAAGDATILIGLHDNCDALVATAVLERGRLAAAEPLCWTSSTARRCGLGRGHARALAKTKRAARAPEIDRAQSRRRADTAQPIGRRCKSPREPRRVKLQ